MQRIAGLRHVQPRQRRARCRRPRRTRGRGRPSARHSASACSTSLSAFLIDLPERSCSARPPSGSVLPPLIARCPAHPPVPAIRRRDRRPCRSAGGTRRRRRSAVSSASRLPEITSILRPADALRLGDEILAVARIAAGRGGEHPKPLDLHRVAERAEPAQRRERSRHRILGHQPLGLHLAAKAGQDLFVEQRRGAARHALVDHEADRVRPDVDDGDRRPVIEAALRGDRRRTARFCRLTSGA